jgi:hypothetical protein
MLIDNVGIVWHRLWSMRLTLMTVAYTSAAGGWAVIPDDWKPAIPHVLKVVLAGVGVLLPTLAAAAIVIKQPALPVKVEELKSEQELS